MEKAAEQGFNSLFAFIEKEEPKFKEFFLPVASQITTINKVDHSSVKLYPKDNELCKDYIPTPIYGDGNCLCRTGAMYLFGSEEYHKEIRARVVAEMTINKDWYLSNPDIRQYAQFTERLEQSDNLRQIEGIAKVFERCTIRFTKSASWGEMWNLMALCNVIGCTVYSIYPDLAGTKRDRKLFHRKIDPRIKVSSESIRIMWTNLSCNSFNDKWWIPNHFVACIPNLENSSTASTPARKPVTLGDYLTMSNLNKSKVRSQISYDYTTHIVSHK